jgi:hypothetical protein
VGGVRSGAGRVVPDRDAAGGGKAGGTCRIAFADYGRAPTPTEPAAEDRSEEGEEKIYEILNG